MEFNQKVALTAGFAVLILFYKKPIYIHMWLNLTTNLDIFKKYKQIEFQMVSFNQIRRVLDSWILVASNSNHQVRPKFSTSVAVTLYVFSTSHLIPFSANWYLVFNMYVENPMLDLNLLAYMLKLLFRYLEFNMYVDNPMLDLKLLMHITKLLLTILRI